MAIADWLTNGQPLSESGFTGDGQDERQCFDSLCSQVWGRVFCYKKGKAMTVCMGWVLDGWCEWVGIL